MNIVNKAAQSAPTADTINTSQLTPFWDVNFLPPLDASGAYDETTLWVTYSFVGAEMMPMHCLFVDDTLRSDRKATIRSADQSVIDGWFTQLDTSRDDFWAAVTIGAVN